MNSAPRSIGDSAREYNAPLWRVRRLFTQGILPEPPRVGVLRVVDDELNQRIGEELRRRGYLDTGLDQNSRRSA